MQTESIMVNMNRKDTSASRLLAKDNLLFLSEASNILNSSLDYNATLVSVADLIVSNIADFCIIDLMERNGHIRRVAVKDADSHLNTFAQQMYNYPPNPKVKGAIYDAARSGKAILIPFAEEEWLKQVAYSEELQIIRRLGLNSHMFVPLKSRGRVIGVLTFASRSSAPFTKEDVVLAEELAVRAGIAVDNARLYKEAQDAVRARDEFLSIASHELKTPLTSILLQLQIVLGSIRKESSEIPTKRLETMLENTEQQSKKLSKLINDLLNISLITTGRLTLDKEKVNFPNLVKDILRRYEEQIKKSNYDVTTEIRNNIFGCWDKVRIEQVISNLISNAIKYGDRKPISIQVNKRNNQALFIIKDNGIGITSPFQKQIFERFARGVSPKHYRGLGVGLYISKNIIEAHGGSIKVKSVLRKGSLFSVELPLKN